MIQGTLMDRLVADRDFMAARQLVAEAWSIRDPHQAKVALDMQRREMQRIVDQRKAGRA